jgi:outer membrane protein TolC
MRLAPSARNLILLSALLLAPRAAAAEALDSLLARPTLEVARLERAVLERNPSLAAMRSAWRAAEAAADQAGALMDPMLDVATAPGTWRSGTVDPTYMVSLRQRLPIFGQRGLMKRAGRAMARAAGEEVRTERQALLRETRASFGEYYRNARARDVNRELKDLVAQMRRTALAKYEAGIVGLADVLQAEVEIAMLDHDEVALERDRRTLVAMLNSLLRRDATASFPPPDPDLPIRATPMRADSAIALARGMRPELRGVDAMRDARRAERALADRQRLPEFEIEARYDRFMEETEMRPQVGVGLNLPIQLGRIGAARREARAKLDEIEWRRTALLARIDAEAAAAAARVEEIAHELMIVEGRVVPATERALDAARAAYEANRGEFITLLNAERDLARARLSLYETKVRYFDAAAELDRAVGAGTAEEREEVTR